MPNNEQQGTTYPIYNQYIRKNNSWVLVGGGGSGGDFLPDQTNNSGKFLTTDGTDVSWSNINPNIPYLTCETAADTAAKTTTLVSGSFGSTDLVAGAQVLVKITNANGIANPTISINGTTAKSIKRYGTTAPGTSAASSWNAGAIVMLVYDGTYWQMEAFMNTTYSGMSDTEVTAGTSTSNRLISPARLKTAIQIWAPTELPDQTNNAGKVLTTNGTVASWENINPNVPYLTCSTNGYTAAKTTTLVNGTFTSADLVQGAQVLVKFTYSNSATNPTININNTGAISIKRYGTVAAGSTESDSWKANSIVMLVYDGTNWIIQNSTYSSMTIAEINSGNESSDRVISPAKLKTAIQTWALPQNNEYVPQYLRHDGPDGDGTAYWDELPVYEQTDYTSLQLFEASNLYMSDPGSWSYSNYVSDNVSDFADYIIQSGITNASDFPQIDFSISSTVNWDASMTGSLICSQADVSTAVGDYDSYTITCTYETPSSSGWSLEVSFYIEYTYDSMLGQYSGVISSITLTSLDNNPDLNPANILLSASLVNITIHQLDGKFLNENAAPLNTYMKKGIDYVTAGKQDGTTLGTKATAEGEYNTASGARSHAEGYYSKASGAASHAENYHTTASGSYAHAEGYYTTASGNYSHAEGYYTAAQRKSQHVFGEYNKLDTVGSATARGTYVEIVGNGGSASNRSNARTLDWSGNETLAGKLTLGADPTANMEAATKQYVDGKVSTLGTVLNYKGTKASAAQLPTSGNTTGDVWIVTIDNSEHVWNGSAWEEFGPTIDLSGYATLASPAFTGTPTAPTPTSSSGNTQIATKGYVDTKATITIVDWTTN